MINLKKSNHKYKNKIILILSLVMALLIIQSVSFAATNIENCVITITGTYNYDGNAQIPTYTIVDPATNQNLVETVDYSKQYVNIVDAGVDTAKIVFSGRKNYSGTVEKTFSINKRDLYITPVSNQSKQVGVPDQEFKFTYSNNVQTEYPKFDGFLSRVAGEEEGQYNILKGNLSMVEHGLFKPSNYNLIVDETVKFTIEDRNSFTLEFLIEDSNKTLKLPIPSKPLNNYVVSWGDGQATYVTEEGFPEHTYSEAGTYTVRISGTVYVFGFFNDAEVDTSGVYSDYYTFCNSLRKIVSFGDIKAERMGFSKCKNLAGTIPAPTGFSLFKSVENFFNGCEKLTGSIPTGFFKNLESANSAKNAFKGCVGLTGTLEPTLFEGSTRIRSFEGTFSNLISYTGTIPEDLFKDATHNASFDSTFYGMLQLNGEIPSGLFKNNTLVQSFSQTFGNCSSLTGVPENLFENNDIATNYYRTFYNCRSFTEVPVKLFTHNRVRDISNNSAIKNDYNGTFEGCTGINYLESDLYVFGYNMFAGCNSIEEILLIHPAKIGKNAFSGCNKLKTIMVSKEKLFEIGENAFLYNRTDPAIMWTYINQDNEILKNYNWEQSKRAVDTSSPKGTVTIVSPTAPYTNTRNVVLRIDVEDDNTNKSNIQIAILNDVMYTQETTATLENYRTAISEHEARLQNPATTEEEKESLRTAIQSLQQKIRDIEIGKMPEDMLAWEPFVENKDWVLTAEDGIKTVYVYFKDEMGNISNFIQNF